MVGWIVSGFGRMLPQPVPKQVSRCSTSFLIHTYKLEQQTITEYVVTIFVPHMQDSDEVQDSKYNLKLTHEHSDLLRSGIKVTDA